MPQGIPGIVRKIDYDPLPSQRKFHFAEARFKGFSGPVGSGKSAALCQEAIRLAYINRGRIGLLGAPTYSMLRDSALVAFREVCLQNSIPYVLNKANHTVRMTEVGTTILFRSLEKFDHLRGPNLAWFGIDEMTYAAEDAWVRLEARLRDPQATELCGFGVWTPKGFDWAYRRFKADRVEGYGLIEAAPFENEHLLRVVPDYYQRLESSYDSGFFEQEVLGKYVKLDAGAVYREFERSKHVGEFEYDAALPLLWSWDFNINPMASVICQRRGPDLFVVDELYIRTSSTPEVCDEFVTRYGAHPSGVQIYGDASGFQRRSVTGTSDIDIIREFLRRNPRLGGNVVIARSNPPVRDRINAVNGALRNAIGESRLFMDSGCRELIKDMEQVVYKSGTGIVDKFSDANRTHLADALGYLVWTEGRTLAKIGEQRKRLM